MIQENERIFEHVQTLMKQGNYLELTKLQGSDATWQSFLGAHTGHINNDNKKRLKPLHSFCITDINLKKFKENISSHQTIS